MLRYEIIDPATPWAPLSGDALGVPYASGTLQCTPGSYSTGLGPLSNVIEVPPSPTGAPHVLLVLDAFGGHAITFAAPGSTPSAGDNQLPEADTVPRVYIAGTYDGDRAREVRYVKPGTRFAARSA